MHVQLTHSDVLSFDAKGPVRRLADVSAGTQGESLTNSVFIAVVIIQV